MYFISHVGEIFRQTIRWNFFYYNLNSGKILVRALGLSHFNGVLQLTTGKFRGPTLEGLVNSSPAAFSPAVDVGSLHVESVTVFINVCKQTRRPSCSECMQSMKIHHAQRPIYIITSTDPVRIVTKSSIYIILFLTIIIINSFT